MLLDTAGFDGLNATTESGRDAINHVFLASPRTECLGSANPTFGVETDDLVNGIHLKTAIHVRGQFRHRQEAAGVESALNGVI